MTTTEPDKDRGLYRKYELWFVKEDDCGNVHQTYEVTEPFFAVLYTTDPFARPALVAYAHACEAEDPGHAAELRRAQGPHSDGSALTHGQYLLRRVKEDDSGSVYQTYEVTDPFLPLFYTTDPYARAALAAYAQACEAEYPALAADLRHAHGQSSDGSAVR